MATKRKWTDVMVDIETLGTIKNAVILSIAAVPFNIAGKKTTGAPDHATKASEQFSVNISIDSCLKVGLEIQEETLLWWMRQEKAAIDAAFFPKESTTLGNALFKFREFLTALNPSNLAIWGNSARFDLGMLDNGYMNTNTQNTDRVLPWKYSKERDVRTLVSLAPEFKSKNTFVGVKHDPIADCINQINYCTQTFNYLKKDN